MKKAKAIGPLVPWCCTYYVDGVPYGITLYAVPSGPDNWADQIENDWGIKVEGRKIGETQW